MFRPAIVMLLLVFVVPGQAACNEALIDEVFALLQFNDKQLRALLESGTIIYTGMAGTESLPEELAVSGALLLVRRPVLEVVETYLAEETFRNHHDIIDYGYLRLDSEASDFAGFSAGEQQELKRLRNFKAGTVFNMSRAEIELLHQAVDDPDGMYRELLQGRNEAYFRRGVQGLSDYARSGGKSVSPAREQRIALKSTADLLRRFPQFREAVHNYPSGVDELEHQHIWMKTRLDGRPLYVLSHHMVDKLGDVALGIERHYYVGHGYNSLLTVVGVAPWRDGDSLVFAINHTFTDQVTGFGASIKRSQGRKLVGKKLVETFRELRDTLESR